MLGNNFKISWRYLLHNKFFSAINIIGLAIGLASATLILLWISEEYSYDQFHEKKDRIYQVYNNLEIDGQIETLSRTPHVLAPEVELTHPEVEKIARVNWVGAFIFHTDDKHLEAQGYLTDPDFLQIFSFPLLKGDPATALSTPRSMVITERMAKKIFGDEEALNKTIRVDSTALFTVTGIVKDLPANTRFGFEYLIPWSFTKEVGWEEINWKKNTIQTFVLLREGVEEAHANEQLADIIRSNSDLKSTVFLHPLAKWHMWSRFENGKITGGMIDSAQRFGLIAGLILLIACINYMNLSSARGIKRGREIGICKVVGAGKQSLMLRFLGESVILSFVAAFLSLIIVQLVLPWFNQLFFTDLHIPLARPSFWGMMLAFTLLTGVLAGSYPALYLSSYKPINAIKGAFKFSHSPVAPRKVLMIVQFMFAIILIISTLVIHRQIKYAQQRDAGFNKENLVFMYLKGEIPENYPSVRHDLLNSGAITSITRTNSPAISIWNWDDSYTWEGKDAASHPSLIKLHTDLDFVQTMGLKIVEGRDIDISKYPTDSTAVLLNEAAVKLMRFKDPIGQQLESKEGNWHVVGVIKDFVPGMAYSTMQPMVVQGPGPQNWFGTMTFRLSAHQATADNLETIQDVLRKYDPEVPFVYFFTDDMYQSQFSFGLRIGSLANLSSGLAILVSCLGLFALASYLIEARIKEIGIRKVLGATVMSIAALLSKDFLKLVAIAIILASPLAWWIMNNWLQNFAYRVDISWTLFVFTGLSLAFITLLTVGYQAIQAALTNPVKSLKSE